MRGSKQQRGGAVIAKGCHALSAVSVRQGLLGFLMWGVAVATIAQSVTLTDNGSTVTLANGIVSAVIDKSNGRCTDLRKGGGPNLLANGGRVYFDANGSSNGGSSSYVSFTPDSYSVVLDTTQRVEIALTDTNLTGFNAELHYILRAADSGLYVYTLWRHGPGDPSAVLSQSRMVVRCDPNLFTRAYSSPEKTGQMIEPSLLVTSPKIMDATYKLPLGSSYTNVTGFTDDSYPTYTKYDWSDYMEEHAVHGVAGDDYGIWVVMGSVEYFNGGPTKANQTVHGTDTTPVVLWVFQGTHFGASPIVMDADESWSKMNGPYFLYVNSGTNAAGLWGDAQNKAAEEKDLWPYAWITHNDYPTDRGTVSGTLHVAGQSTSNALLVLAQAGTYWQLQDGTGYQFWTRAEANGSFTIPKVRPGSYALFAQVPGVIGIMEQPGITVTAGQTSDLGVVHWEPARYERRLFRLGTPDLGAAEFRFGSGMRQYGLWWRYLEEQGTNDIDFLIGTGVPSNDWYYALSLLPIEITSTNGVWISPRWNIHFVVDEIPPAPARLSVELAGAIRGCAFYVFVNGVNICPNPSTGIYTVNDSGIYRSAARSALQQRFELVFDPNLLLMGTNTISFTVRGTGSSGNPWSGTKPTYPRAGIIFDCIQLDAGTLLTEIAPEITDIEMSGSSVILSGTGGIPTAHYLVLYTTNTMLSLDQWMSATTNQFDAKGEFECTNFLLPGGASGFYLLQVP